jgi:hypothetical protein
MNKAEKAVSEAMQDLMTELNEKITKIAGQEMGISLCVFNAVPGGRINYVSNCDRTEVKNAWQSMIKGWDEGMPDVPAHKVQ